MLRFLIATVGMFVISWAGTSAGAPCAGFTDVDSASPFCANVAWMKNRGVTLGCTATQYCPNDPTSRLQMAAFMNRLGEALFPSTCAAGEVMKWNGLEWDCASDNIGGSGGGGTVTSVAAGTGLAGTPNPITGAGTLTVATGYRLPQACTNGQVAKSNGSGGWVCAADAGGTGTVTSITAGAGLTGGTITGSGTIAADTSFLQRRVSSICAAGSSIRAIAADGTVTCQTDTSGAANAFVQGGNAFGADAVLGTTDASRAVNVIAANARVMRFEPNANGPNILGGHPNNSVGAFSGQTVAGGGAPGSGCLEPSAGYVRSCANRAEGHNTTVGGGRANIAGEGRSTVAGGESNTASGFEATVAGGSSNTARAVASTVAGGYFNTASGIDATVGGGNQNTAAGSQSTVPGGYLNSALGRNSFAAGTRATAAHTNSFVWGGSEAYPTTTSAEGDFVVYAPSRIRLFAGTAGTGGCEIGSSNIGGNLSCGGTITATSFVPTSDRAQKSRIVAVDVDEVLTRVVALPITQWSYNAAPEVRHLGPMGQDFHEAFGLGATDKGIATVDADGVALAAIQGLNAKLEATVAEQAKENAQLRSELAELRSLKEEMVSIRAALSRDHVSIR